MAVAPDIGVFEKNKGFSDYQRANEEFQLKKALAQAQIGFYGARSVGAAKGGNLPATLQVANALAAARGDGLPATENDIIMAGKLADRGLAIDANGNYTSLPGYAGAVGAIEQGKQTGKNISDLAYKPAIAGGEANAKNNSELNYAAPIAEKKETGKGAGEVATSKLKKGAQSDDTIFTLDLIERPDAKGKSLLDKATGSGAGAIVAGGKGFVGTSDESTQANADLVVLGNRLVNNVPRMEGPQSDSDRVFYAAQAGRIADPKIPAGDKKSAIQAIRELNLKYAGPPAQPVILSNDKDAASVDAPAAPKLGEIRKGHAYIGGDPSKQSSWKALKK